MTTVYSFYKLLIQKNRTDGLQDEMDVYPITDRLTPEEYQELAGLFAPEMRQQSAARPPDKRRGAYYEKHQLE